jgi:hypothetical protein
MEQECTDSAWVGVGRRSQLLSLGPTWRSPLCVPTSWDGTLKWAPLPTQSHPWGRSTRAPPRHSPAMFHVKHRNSADRLRVLAERYAATVTIADVQVWLRARSRPAPT